MPGDFIGDRPVNSLIHPAGLPITTSSLEVLRGPVDSTQFAGSDFDELGVLLKHDFFGRVAASGDVDLDRVELVDRFCVRDPVLEQLMMSFLPELQTQWIGGELYSQSLAQALGIHLLRKHSSLGERAQRRIAPQPRPSRGLTQPALGRVTDHIEDHLAATLTLDALAGLAHISPHHFSRLFKQATGHSPHQYVIHRRVERAKALLTITDQPIAQVALACGFSHHSHLNHHFKRLVGLTPTAYAQQTRAQKVGASVACDP